jgi:hypothetical protein
VADRRPFPSDAQLEAVLHQLGRELAYPPTPDLVGRVVSRLESAGSTPLPPGEGQAEGVTRVRTRVRLLPSRWVLAAALLLGLLLGTLAVSPTARTVVADRLGLRGVDLFHVPFVPTPTPTPTATPAPTGVPTPTPPPAGPRLGLGQPVALADAARQVAFTPVRPTAPELGEPDEVYAGTEPAGGRVSFVYRARPGVPAAGETSVGLLLVQFRASIEAGFMGKGLGPGTRLESVVVNGRPAFWIEGQPHFVIFRGPDRNIREDQIRLAGNVLLWEQGELTLRIEGALGKELALRIASSVR